MCVGLFVHPSVCLTALDGLFSNTENKLFCNKDYTLKRIQNNTIKMSSLEICCVALHFGDDVVTDALRGQQDFCISFSIRSSSQDLSTKEKNKNTKV